MEFLEVLESIRAEDASVQKLFGGEGTNVRAAAASQTPNPTYKRNLLEAVTFIDQVMRGKRPAYHLREALTTSDFPLLFGDILDRQLLANYRETTPTYPNYCKVGTVTDFRAVKKFTVDGAESVLAKVAQQEEYPETKLTEAYYTYSVEKYGRAIPFSWETMINDDLDALKDIPARFGKAARRTEEKFATALFCAAGGPDATYFSAAHKNIVTVAAGATLNNPILSIAGLQDALTLLMSQVDADSEPIEITMVELVIPPQLKIVAENILNATELWLNAQGATSDQQLHTRNWLQGGFRLNVNYYLPIVNTTNGKTAWYLFASTGESRPAVHIGKLRGHEEPEIWMKQPDAIRIGGGGVNPMDGDFETDSIRYRVRHVLGGTLADPKGAVVSKGTASA